MGASKNSSALSNYAYTLGAAGNRTSVAELSGRAVAYAYDSLYRLTTETVTADPGGKNGAIAYTFDAVGNRKTLNATLPPAGAISYTYDADDRLGSDTYDAAGNTINSGGIADSYDFENHLITHGAVAVVYDGDGNRVSETVGGVTTNYLVDTVNPTGYAQVVDELQSGTVARAYSYGLERISEKQASGTSFYGYDGHGSVRQLTNSAGAVTDTYDYDAFGNLINLTGTTPNMYRFAGEAYDAALGLYYNRARYLNTTTGRFWSMDSDEGDSRDPLSLHKYLYVADNAPNSFDPSGHEIDSVSLAAAAGAITTLATTSLVIFQNVVGGVYVALYEAPQIVETANNYLVAGLGAFEALEYLGTNILNYAQSYSSIPIARGNQFEQAAGANLGPTFPVYDYFDQGSGAAVQIRSTTQTQSMEALLGVVQKGVNKINSAQYPLRGFDRGGSRIIITQEEVQSKGLLIGIPAEPLPWFNIFIQRVQQISQAEGVEITVQFVQGLEGETGK
jgi:RHS repeat-associated protein